MNYGSVRRTFHELALATGLRSKTAWPRIHDLRHSFAVQTLIDLHRAGADIHAHIGTLSIYLGLVRSVLTFTVPARPRGAT